MEIDNNIKNQSLETPYNNKNNKIPEQDMILIEDKIKNKIKDEKANYIPKNSEEINSPKIIGRTYNFILKPSNDSGNISKEKEISHQNDKKIVQNICNKSNSYQQNNSSSNINMPDHIFVNDPDNKKNEDKENKTNVGMIVEDDINKNKDNIVHNKEVTKYKDICENWEEIDNYNNNKYNPFNTKNKKDDKKSGQKKNELEDEDIKYLNQKGKFPNIILTAFSIPIKNAEEKKGSFSSFFNIFRSKKKEKETNKIEEINKDEKESNRLKTLEEKLKEENIIVKEDKEEKDEIIGDQKNDKYNFVLSTIPTKKNESKGKKIINENKNIENIEKNQEKEIISDNNNFKENKNEKNIIIHPELIVSNDNINNISNEDNNIYVPEKLEDIDKSSQFSYFSELSIVKLMKKNSKCSILLTSIVLGSCGLFYLLYKKINVKEIISKFVYLVKVIPGFFSNIFSVFCVGLADFLERYDDIYRLLAGIILLICFWFLFKMLMNSCIKGKKK